MDLSKQQAQYNNLDVKLSNSQLNKFKSGIKNGTGVTLKISSNVYGDASIEVNFLHKLLFTNTHISRVPSAFLNGSSAHVKLSNT